MSHKQNSSDKMPIKRFTRRKFVRTTSVAGVLGIAGCLGGDDDTANGEAEVEMEIGSAFEPGHINVEAAEMLKERIEDETDGRFQVTITPGGAYGADDEIADLVREGSLEAVSGALTWQQYALEYVPFIDPFVLEEYEGLLNLWDSDLLQEQTIPEVIEQGNQRPLAPDFYRGERHFTSNIPIREPEDVQGVDLRLPEQETWVAIWSEIGIDATTVALDELYSALETGVADASEGDVEQLHSFNLWEVQDYCSLTGHRAEHGNIFFNDDFYQGLDESDRDLLDEIMVDVGEEATEITRDREQERINELEENGMTIIDDVNTEAFTEAAQPAIQSNFEEFYEFSYDEFMDAYEG